MAAAGSHISEVSLQSTACLVLLASIGTDFRKTLFSGVAKYRKLGSSFLILLQDPRFYICRLTSLDVCGSPLILEGAPVPTGPKWTTVSMTWAFLHSCPSIL